MASIAHTNLNHEVSFHCVTIGQNEVVFLCVIGLKLVVPKS